jgi:hypothetical protein
VGQLSLTFSCASTPQAFSVGVLAGGGGVADRLGRRYFHGLPWKWAPCLPSRPRTLGKVRLAASRSHSEQRARDVHDRALACASLRPQRKPRFAILARRLPRQLLPWAPLTPLIWRRIRCLLPSPPSQRPVSARRAMRAEPVAEGRTDGTGRCISPPLAPSLGPLPGRSRDLQRASRGLLTLALLKEAMAALRRQPFSASHLQRTRQPVAGKRQWRPWGTCTWCPAPQPAVGSSIV